jgi:hypothetical protein
MVLFGLLAVSVLNFLAGAGVIFFCGGLPSLSFVKTPFPARTLKTATANKPNKTIRQAHATQGHQN